MSFITPRASGLWDIDVDVDENDRMGYFPDDAEALDSDDGRTPLDKTIDRIGMGVYIRFSVRSTVFLIVRDDTGPYQWTLLSLCGFGEF